MICFWKYFKRKFSNPKRFRIAATVQQISMCFARVIYFVSQIKHFSFIDMRMNQCNSALKSKIMIYQMLISCNFKKILHRNITELRIDSSVMSIKHPFSTNDDITNSIWMLRNCKKFIEADNIYLIFIAYFTMPYNVFMYALIGGL